MSDIQTIHTFALKDNDTNIPSLAGRKYHEICQKLGERIVGMEKIIDQVLIAIFSGSHAVFVGVPGLAKTLLVRSIAEIMDLKFSRIQFTPDLMPSDITGTYILRENTTTGERDFIFSEGPIFGNLILADEINRTPPKTQAALLEVMEEHTITVWGKKHTLHLPIIILATQNPIEQEGTYPLPMAQLDRFMFQIELDYPSFAEEKKIMRDTLKIQFPPLSQVLTFEEYKQIYDYIHSLKVSSSFTEYAVNLCRATRKTTSQTRDDTPDFTEKWVSSGVSPKGTHDFILACKTRAVLHNRTNICWEDVQALAHASFSHRILLNYCAAADDVTTHSIIDQLLKTIKLPQDNI